MTDNDIEKYFLSLYKKLLNVKYDLKITRNEFLALNSVHDLLKRQREEIDKLKVREITCECRELQIEHATLVRVNWEAALIQGIKAEAIKEFVERLHGKAHYSEDFNKMAVPCEYIDDLVKEMTEETNDGTNAIPADI